MTDQGQYKTSILHWISGSNSAETIAKMHSIQRRNLINDGRKKNRQRRQTKGRQKSIAGYDVRTYNTGLYISYGSVYILIQDSLSSR
jgi:hypothetical protein